MKVFAFVKKQQNFNSEKGITPSPFGPVSSHLYQKKNPPHLRQIEQCQLSQHLNHVLAWLDSEVTHMNLVTGGHQETQPPECQPAQLAQSDEGELLEQIQMHASRWPLPERKTDEDSCSSQRCLHSGARLGQ